MKPAQNSHRHERDWGTRTRLVRGGTRRSGFGETSEAIFMNSGFCYESAEQAEARFKGDAPGFVYSRYGNPTVAMFERRLALLEGAEACFATASGMAAVFASMMCQLRCGDHVVSGRALFGSCHFIITELLPRWGIETTLVDGPDIDQWRAAIGQKTRCVFFETPANPTLEIIDMAAVADLAHAVGASVIVDNVFSTPVLQRPFEFGADIVVYSGTKHIDGQGRTLGGAVVSDETFRNDVLQPFMRHTGPSLSPFNAWVLLKGLETLELRLERHCATARTIAGILAEHPAVKRVIYPGFESHPQFDLASRQMADGGTIITFEIKGGKKAAFRLLNSLEIIDISNNLGDSKSLITHPATTTHRAMGEEARARIGVTDEMVRLSVGLEDPNDLAGDLLQGLNGLKATRSKRRPARESRAA